MILTIRRSVFYVTLILVIGLANSNIVPDSMNNKNDLGPAQPEPVPARHNLKKLIDFFNLYDSLMQADEEPINNINQKEIDDREIELLMLTLPRMGRVFNEEKKEVEDDGDSDEINEIANNEISMSKRAVPRFGKKRAIPRFGKRAIPRFG